MANQTPIPKMGEFRDRRGKLAFEVTGHGDWVVFCHALATNRRLWDAQVRDLARDWTVLTFDLRGHGYSAPAADDDYSFEALADDVVHLMDEVGAVTAAVVGISVGGEVAQQLAGSHPARVESLFLSSTACVTSPERAVLWRNRIAEAEAHGMGSTADAAVQRWFTPDFRANHADQVLAWRTAIAETAVVGYAGIGRTIERMDLRPELAKIRCPTLVLAGEHDAATGAAAGQQIAAGIAGSKFRLLHDVGHLWNLEAPAAFNTELKQWLMRTRELNKGSHGKKSIDPAL